MKCSGHLFGVLILFTATQASAYGPFGDEDRCGDIEQLGGTCLCSEPLNTDTFTYDFGGGPPGNDTWNPGDTTGWKGDIDGAAGRTRLE